MSWWSTRWWCCAPRADDVADGDDADDEAIDWVGWCVQKGKEPNKKDDEWAAGQHNGYWIKKKKEGWKDKKNQKRAVEVVMVMIIIKTKWMG